MDRQTKEARESVKRMSFPDKIKHFWYYNGKMTIILLLIAIVVGYSIYQMVTATKYDLEIAYYGERNFTNEQIESLENYLGEFIEDVDGNGEKNVNFNVITHFPKEESSTGEYDMAIQQKFMAELYAGTYSAYIVSPEFYEMLSPESEYEVTESSFELNDSSALKEILGEADNEHWCRMVIYESKKDNEKSNLLYKNAKLAEDALLSGK